MMRSPGLEYWVKSPYLRLDTALGAAVPKDLEKAEKFLKEAPGKKDALEQVNVAYQSMYCAAQALLHSIHYKATNFRCIVTVLEEHFIKKGILNRDFLERLLAGQKMEGTPQDNFDAAAYCIAAARKALNQ